MKPEDERDAVWKAMHTNADRITELEVVVNTRNEMMRETIQNAVREAMPSTMMTDEEHSWVKLAIQREAQMIAFRRAVIEKTLLGLVWAGIIGAGILVREYMIAHGMWRP